jgi:predicted nuclease of restriction endonuclease-like RecB superfamily
VRFGLQDLKKQVYRREGELYVGLHFLRAGELRAEIERLIAYHQQMLGQPRRKFSMDDARACIGDYRLAHCLISTLSYWYRWQQRSWSDVLQQIDGESRLLLEKAGITSPVHLRLALYTYVNEHHQGFLHARSRPAALQAFADSYQLSVPDLEYQLALDSDDEELLLRDSSQPPGAQDVATLYNQWAFESALFNASNVHFVIDCRAFEQASSGTGHIGSGIGTVIKRLCYLARLLGVYYDLTYDPATVKTDPLLHLTLYGPQEMTGAPQQYGARLARLCRLLLGYGVSQRQQNSRAPGPQKHKNAQTSASVLSSAIIKAEATVHFLQRSYRFAMDNALLSLLPAGETPAAPGTAEIPPVLQQAPTASSSVFDSSIEQTFAEAFAALESSHAVDGWQLIREPEPLLFEQNIFIPDFALTRDQRRLYVEILGFWTPSYRERKVQKLQQLRERGDIVLAIPEEAREAFASLVSSFPIAWYSDQLSATELLQLVRSHNDDLAERLAALDITAVRERVRQEGFLTKRTCYELLHVYRRSELQMAAARVVNDDVAFAAGLGLYQVNWMEQLRTSFVVLIETLGVSSLTDILREARVHWPSLAECEDLTIETMLGLWPEVSVRRSSIFEATVTMTNHSAEQIATANGEEQAYTVPGRKLGREKRTIQKKRVVRETSQGDLWS